MHEKGKFIGYIPVRNILKHRKLTEIKNGVTLCV